MNVDYNPIVDLSGIEYEKAIKVIQNFTEQCKGVPVYLKMSICDYEHSYPVKGEYIMQLYGVYAGDLLVREDAIADVFNTSPTPKRDIETDYVHPFSDEQLEALPHMIDNLFFTYEGDKILSIGTSIWDIPPMTIRKHLLTTLESFEVSHVS